MSYKVLTNYFLLLVENLERSTCIFLVKWFRSTGFIFKINAQIIVEIMYAPKVSDSV